MIEALQFVNQCYSLAKAKTIYQGSDLADFKRTLKELHALNINPVTIPKEWGTKYIPNILYAYYDKEQPKKDGKQMEAFQPECLDEYIKDSVVSRYNPTFTYISVGQISDSSTYPC